MNMSNIASCSNLWNRSTSNRFKHTLWDSNLMKRVKAEILILCLRTRALKEQKIQNRNKSNRKQSKKQDKLTIMLRLINQMTKRWYCKSNMINSININKCKLSMLLNQLVSKWWISSTTKRIITCLWTKFYLQNTLSIWSNNMLMIYNKKRRSSSNKYKWKWMLKMETIVSLMNLNKCQVPVSHIINYCTNYLIK